MKTIKLLNSIKLVIGMLLLSGVALYAMPKGKPFVELEGQIVEVQGQVNTLDERMDDLLASVNTLETKVDTIEGNINLMNAAIDKVNSDNESILNQLSELIDAVAANDSTIQTTLTKIDDLQSQIIALSGSVQVNTAEIELLEGQIAELQDYISQHVEGYQSLLAQVDDNNDLIAALEEKLQGIEGEMALKQSVINADCGEGMALVQINSDGSYECSAVSVSTELQFATLGLTNTIVTNGSNMGGMQRYQSGTSRSCYTSCRTFGGCSTRCYYYPIFSYRPITSGVVSVSCPANTLWTFSAGYQAPDNVSVSDVNLMRNTDGNLQWTYNFNLPADGVVRYGTVSAQCVSTVENPNNIIE